MGVFAGLLVGDERLLLAVQLEVEARDALVLHLCVDGGVHRDDVVAVDQFHVGLHAVVGVGLEVRQPVERVALLLGDGRLSIGREELVFAVAVLAELPLPRSLVELVVTHTRDTWLAA